MSDPLRRFGKRIAPACLHARLRPLGVALDRVALERKVLRDRLTPLRARPHALPGELVVSLTSYPPRFPTLHRTLAGLLRQKVQPDRLILWVGEGDALPSKVLPLAGPRLEIRRTRHLAAFTKLLPALAAFPRAFIAIADDDAYYPPDWLGQLIGGHDPAAQIILCRRAHRIVTDAAGTIMPFASWQKDVRDSKARSPSTDIVPTGVGGVLYPPGSLDPAVSDEELFTRLCPHTDDFWYYWMARRAGSRHRVVGGGFDYRDWPGTQATALHAENLAGRYDREIAALVGHFGLPAPVAGRAGAP